MNSYFRTSAAAVLASLAACASTNTEKDQAPPPTKEMQVTVSGADATVGEDGEIILNYPENDDINYRVPEWVINPALGGVTGAVGVASGNPLGMRGQLDQARWNGRLELASMLELRVQRVARAELEEDARVEGGQDVGSARRETLAIDKEILDTVLAGTRQRALWWDTDSGEVYVWMVVDGALLARVDHAVIRDVSVFTATAKLPSEYLPKRDQPLPPTVIVEMPEGPAPPPEPQAPDTPTEELESALKPIETIPLGEGAEGSGSGE